MGQYSRVARAACLALIFASVGASGCGNGNGDGGPDADHDVASDADHGRSDGDLDLGGDDADAGADDADIGGRDAEADAEADADCVPNDDECGPDGCGGDHGDCELGRACEAGSCVEIPAVFLATFEGGATTADVGTESIDARNGGAMEVVDNPFRSETNDSDQVLRIEVPPGSSVRAEYHSQRLETDERTYVYVWRQHFDADFLAGADPSWLVFSQWKTWPCGEYDGGYGDVICGGGGIFNDIELDGSLYEIRFRAEPDCEYVTAEISTGEVWDTFVLEIYWTNTSAGYYRMYRNDRLLVETVGVKTLFDRFPAETDECDMYWALGLYATWASTGSDALVRYIDDMAIYDVDAGVELSDVCPRCGP